MKARSIKVCRIICCILMCLYVIDAYSTNQTYYVYRTNDTTSLCDFATSWSEIAPNSEVVFQSPIVVDSITKSRYAIDNCILIYGVSNIDTLINKANLGDYILSIDSIFGDPTIYALQVHSLSYFQLDSICDVLNDSNYCEIAELDYAFFDSFNSNINPEQNPKFEDKQWYLDDSSTTNLYSINALSAWNYSTGNEMKIAILDGGIDLTHKDLVDNLIQGYDCTDGLDGYKHGACNYVSDSAAHGTECAGVIGATNDTLGIIGVAPNSKMISIRVYRHKRLNLTKYYGKKSWYIKGFKKAYDVGADIVSCSWDFDYIGNRNKRLMDKIIDELTTKGRDGLGTVVVCASGNDYSSEIGYPSSHSNAIAVGACQRNGYRTDFSNYGSGLDLVAPGVDIYTTTKKKRRQSDGTYIENRYATVKGTSYACPIVAGVAALVLSAEPSLCRDSVETILKQTAYKIPRYFTSDRLFHGEVGYGLVDAYGAILEVNKKYIQDEVYASGESYRELGTYIYIGDSVTNRGLYGEVEVNEDADVLFQATKEIRFTDGFHARAGSNMIAQIVPESEWKNLSSARRSSIRSNAPKNNSHSNTEDEGNISQNFDNGLECTSATITSTNVYSLSGFLLQTYEGENYTLSYLPSGMYILQHRMSDGSVRSEKIVNSR